jgi:hypothetical protein
MWLHVFVFEQVHQMYAAFLWLFFFQLHVPVDNIVLLFHSILVYFLNFMMQLICYYVTSLVSTILKWTNNFTIFSVYTSLLAA